MAGLRPDHPRLSCLGEGKTWMPGTKPRHDEFRLGGSNDDSNELEKTVARTADGLLFRPVPDRSCQRGVAVSGGVGAVDHLRRDADRQFRAWRLLYARRLCRVHADRAIFRRDRLLGRHRCRGADRRCDRRAGRNGAAAADLSCAGTVSTAGDLRPDPDGRGSGGPDLGPERSARPPRAGIEGRGRFLRPECPDLRSVPDRARSGRARSAVAVVPAHPLGRAGSRRDAGPRHGGRARRQSEMAVHQRVCGRRVPGGTRRRAADSARRGQSRDGPADHRRRLRGGGDRRSRQHRRRLCRGGAGLRTERVRHPDLPEDIDHPGVPGDGRGADRAAMGPVRKAGGGGAPHAGADGQSVAAADGK